MEIKAVDPATVARLSGIFAPIQDEIDVGPLEVVQGSIPRELTGVYLRTAWRARVRAGRSGGGRRPGLCRHVCDRRRNAPVLLSYPACRRHRGRASRHSTNPSSGPGRTPRLLGPRELTYNVEELRHYFCNWRVVNATVLRTGIEVCLIELMVQVSQFTRQLQQL